MKIQISKKMMWIIISAFLLAILIGLGCSLFIHNLGDVLRGAEGLLGKEADTFGNIFDQLKMAEVELPSLVLLLLCLLETTGVFHLMCGKKGAVLEKKNRVLRRIGMILLALLGAVLIMLITLWFTDVNGIRFGTVLKFLYIALQNGVF